MSYKLIFVFLTISLSLFSQGISDGEVYFNTKQYAKARSVYEILLRKKPNNPLYNYRYARCCYEMQDVQSAIQHFETSRSTFPLSHLYLGELYYKTYYFDESVSSYQTYIASLDSTDTQRTELLSKLKKSMLAAQLMTKVEEISIIDSVTVNKPDFLQFYKVGSELGSLSQDSLNISNQLRTDKIKYITQRQDRMYFSDTIRGRMHLFTSYKLLDGWSKPSFISDVINTPSNQNYPFFLSDGVTMYFASDGENSIGGYDLFVTRFDPSTNTYLPPENIGFPFNSLDNDYMMVIDEHSKRGWFATDRNQPAGKVVVYTFLPNHPKVFVRTENRAISNYKHINTVIH